MRIPSKAKQLALLQATVDNIAKSKTEAERVQCVFAAFQALGIDSRCRARLAVKNKDKTAFNIRHVWGDHGNFDFRNVNYEGGNSLTGYVVKQEQPVEFTVKPVWRGKYDYLVKPQTQIQSALGIPVPRGGAVIGALIFDSPIRNGFSHQHGSVLKPYAALLGTVLDIVAEAPQELSLISLINRTRQRHVLVLGKDTGDELHSLVEICGLLTERHCDPILIKTQPDIPELSNEEKVRIFADHSRFVVLENSYPAGQIAELKMCATNRIITATLRESGHGSSFMVTDYFKDFDFIKEFEYTNDKNPLKDTLAIAIEWAEKKIKERAEYYNSLYPWRKPKPQIATKLEP